MSNIDNDENVLTKARKIQENRDKIEKEKKLRERKAIKDRVHKLQQETQERKQKKDVLIKENLIKSKEEFKRIEPSINILRESIASLKKDMDEKVNKETKALTNMDIFMLRLLLKFKFYFVSSTLFCLIKRFISTFY